jgi:peptide/nickel transport system substrate-binding protein
LNTENHQNITFKDNRKWQLSELVDLISAEIDHAQDTLELKSYSRDIVLGIKNIKLDLGVKTHRSPDGKLWFRTLEDNETSESILKLDFTLSSEHQFSESQQSYFNTQNFHLVPKTLTDLPNITSQQIQKLAEVGIDSITNLERYTRYLNSLVKLSSKTGIQDYILMLWRHRIIYPDLPYITAIKPNEGLLGSIIVIEGGNFDYRKINSEKNASEDNSHLISLEIIERSDSRIIAKVPIEIFQHQQNQSDTISLNIDNSNAFLWKVKKPYLCVLDIKAITPKIIANEDFILTVDLANKGSLDSEIFEVSWKVEKILEEGVEEILEETVFHGPLEIDKQSQDNSVRHQFNLQEGTYHIHFTIDPNQKLSQLKRDKTTWISQIVVKPQHKITIGTYETFVNLDPFLEYNSTSSNILKLIFQGLARLDQETGNYIPELAFSWNLDISNGVNSLIVRLRDDVYFHDQNRLTAKDVKFTYEMLKSRRTSWQKLVQKTIDKIRVLDELTIAFDLYKNNSQSNPLALLKKILPLKSSAKLSKISHQFPEELLTVNIVSEKQYKDGISYPQNLIGTGAFALEKYISKQYISLVAFEQYFLGKPRLDKIDIIGFNQLNEIDDFIQNNEQKLQKFIKENQLAITRLPYSRSLASKLEQDETFKSYCIGSPPYQLEIQSPNLFERDPKMFDVNWNAHQWYWCTDTIGTLANFKPKHNQN